MSPLTSVCEHLTASNPGQRRAYILAIEDWLLNNCDPTLILGDWNHLRDEYPLGMWEAEGLNRCMDDVALGPIRGTCTSKRVIDFGICSRVKFLLARW